MPSKNLAVANVHMMSPLLLGLLCALDLLLFSRAHSSDLDDNSDVRRSSAEDGAPTRYEMHGPTASQARPPTSEKSSPIVSPGDGAPNDSFSRSVRWRGGAWPLTEPEPMVIRHELPG